MTDPAPPRDPFTLPGRPVVPARQRFAPRSRRGAAACSGIPPALLAAVVADAERLAASVAAAGAASTRTAPDVDRLLSDLAAAARSAGGLRDPVPAGHPRVSRQREILAIVRDAMRRLGRTDADVARVCNLTPASVRGMLAPSGYIPQRHMPVLGMLLELPPDTFVNADRGPGRPNRVGRANRRGPARG